MNTGGTVRVTYVTLQDSTITFTGNATDFGYINYYEGGKGSGSFFNPSYTNGELSLKNVSNPNQSFTQYLSILTEKLERLKTDTIYHLDHFNGGKYALKIPGFEFKTDDISYYSNATFSISNLTEKNRATSVTLIFAGPFKDSDFKTGAVKSIAIESNTYLIP